MAVLNIAVFGSDDLCKSIAKPSDHRDVDTYVYKENGANGARILSLIRPVKYPEKIAPTVKFDFCCQSRNDRGNWSQCCTWGSIGCIC